MHFLQYHPLLGMREIPSSHAHPMPAGQRQIAFGQLILMGMNRTPAERIENFLHLGLGGTQVLQPGRAAGQLLDRAESSPDVQPDRTAYPQAHLMHPARRLWPDCAQRLRQIAGQCLYSLFVCFHGVFLPGAPLAAAPVCPGYHTIWDSLSV